MGPLSKDLIILSILICAGAAGGCLSAIQNWATTSKRCRKLMLFRLLQGTAGAIIIVTLSPVDPNIFRAPFPEQAELVTTPPPPVNDQQLFIKLIALALIGGYAGASLLESSASQYAKRLNEIEDRQDTVEQETKRGLDAVRMAEQILHGHQFNASEKGDFKEALNEATSSALFEIAYRADEERRQHWESDKDALERSLLVFEALMDTQDASSNHWWHASLAYCLKDKSSPDYEAAVRCLDKAIELRGSKTRSGAYEFNRAFCCIKIAEKDGSKNRKIEKQIRGDLEAARKFKRFANIIDNNLTVQGWLRRGSVEPLKEIAS
jgi:hypothetical protein